MIHINIDIAKMLIPNRENVRVIQYIHTIPKIRPVGFMKHSQLIKIISERHISKHISLCGLERIKEGFGIRVHVDPFTDYLLETDTNLTLNFYEASRKNATNREIKE